MERCDWTDFLKVESHSEDMDELLSNQAGMACHPLNPAHCGIIIPEESNMLLNEGSSDMLRHKPENDKSC